MATTVGHTVRIDVPEGSFAGDLPLVAVARGDHVGSVHRGIACVADVEGQALTSIGNVEQRVFLRSAAKPFQVMPAVLAGALDRYGISDRELAVLCASHGGEDRHIEAVLSVLQKAGLDEAQLRCGTHPPGNPDSAARLWREGREPSPVCNNCSGAHAGMLLACRANGWPTDGYGDPEHPLQQATRAIVARFSGTGIDDIDLAGDNCAVPTFRLTIRNAACAFARLANPSALDPDLGSAAERVSAAMMKHPAMVGGEQSFDSHVMEAGAGALIAKGGAEAFEGMGLRRRETGIALKISDGGARAIPPASIRLLRRLHIKLDGDMTRWERPELRDLCGHSVGHLAPIFDLEDS